MSPDFVVERQLTRLRGQGGHLLTNANVWSPDSQWIVYDTRSDVAGERFDGETIERIHVESGETTLLYRSAQGAHCGVVSHSPVEEKVVFIHGPEQPTADWNYSACHRQGVLVDLSHPLQALPLEARNLLPPFTPGALRGGTHVHLFSPDGQWVSFTYEDHLLTHPQPSPTVPEPNQRNVGVSVRGHPLAVPPGHPRNQHGTTFSVLVTRTVAEPIPGSDEIKKAFEEAWVGTRGYEKGGGYRQERALAFQGQVVTSAGETISEVFLVDLPPDLTRAGESPLEGTLARRPAPPLGTCQRRLTFTAHLRHPGIQGPRHWLRSAPDGSEIAFLMKDDSGVVQLWAVPPQGGQPRQITRNPDNVASAFTWSPDGQWITHVMNHAVCVTHVRSGQTTLLTPPCPPEEAPRPEACVFSPDGSKIAYVKTMTTAGQRQNQIFVCAVPRIG